MTEERQNLGFGLRPLPKDDRDFALGAFYDLPKLEELPPEFFLMPKKIEDQDNSDLCTAFASTSVTEDQEGIEMSPEFTFAMTKEIEGDFATWGADLRSACKSHTKIGALPKVESPFSLATHSRDFVANWTNWPQELKNKAAIHKKQNYFSVEGPYDLFDDIRASLWGYRLELRSIMTGVLWRPEWTHTFSSDAFNNGIIPTNELPKNGFGHAFKICGWKQIINEPYLIAQLSNGENIGDKGFFYFPRVVVNREFTYGTYMFKDLPPEETKESAIAKSQSYRRRGLSGWLKYWIEEIFR